ncbi:MAG: VacB/RNase II family 3'-5' exoribonuclease [Gammaproteobacteria bacterium]|nr:VacB/RNase II family 3'-5' exoribonuclease [Gammaproteobacteria bacterium]
MLNQDSLSQLQGLKSQMEAEKERASAIVKGTQARYGFAVLEDGREIFIPPQEMLKVFPEDKVQVCIRPAKDNKTIADIEKLLDSPLQDFTGKCVRKGKALFVQPDLAQISRWLFIPPHARNGVAEGDYIRCAVLRHPIRDGKPQAKVLGVIGNAQTPGVENQYCIAKYRLANQWSSASLKEVERILEHCKPLETERRRDLSDLEFVTIDAAKTQDIDDALYAEISEEGWTLFVAIADPTAFIGAESVLQREVAARGTSIYFHGDILPMMPEQLSQDTCALSEGDLRPALVCKISVKDNGEVGPFEFIEATVRSRAKLSYYAVDRYLNGQFDELMSHATPLEALYQVYRALRAHREEHELVMEDRREYRWVLGDNKQIETIEPYEKLLSQKLVEECMVAANRCAGRFLAENGASGPFIAHPGFRRDRLDEVAKFLQMHAPHLAELDATTIEGYRQIMQGLAQANHTLPLRSMANRLLTRAELQTQPSEHMGMALPCYTNCTSPLRKYVDFIVHLQIKSVLHEQASTSSSEVSITELAARIADSRAATMEAERWLANNYLQRLSADGNAQFAARVSHVTSSGFSVRLEDTGLDGFVDLRQDPEKFSYDKWTGSLTSTTRRFQLDQVVVVQYAGADAERAWQANFTPIAGAGLKPPKEDRQRDEPPGNDSVDSNAEITAKT